MQPQTLPSIPAMGVGSYAGPGWYIAMRRRMRAGELGPHDAEELFRCLQPFKGQRTRLHTTMWTP